MLSDTIFKEYKKVTKKNLFKNKINAYSSSDKRETYLNTLLIQKSTNHISWFSFNLSNEYTDNIKFYDIFRKKWFDKNIQVDLILLEKTDNQKLSILLDKGLSNFNNTITYIKDNSFMIETTGEDFYFMIVDNQYIKIEYTDTTKDIKSIAKDTISLSKSLQRTFYFLQNS